MCNCVDYGRVLIHILISILPSSEYFINHKRSVSQLPPQTHIWICFNLAHMLTPTCIHPPWLVPVQCCAMLCCCVCICDLTSPLPCYCSADRCCPTLHSHNPCDPNLHCPCGARCHLSINVTGLFFSFFLYFPTPPPLFFLLSSCWSFFLDPCHSTAR